MKQTSKVIVVLVVFGIGFAVLTGLGFRFPEADDDPKTWRSKPLPPWLTKVGNMLPSRMPPIDLSTTKIVGGTREGDVILVGQTPVTIGVPSSDEDFRRADLSLESGRPVGVHVTDDGLEPEEDETTPEPDEDRRKDKQKVRVIISDKGGTIELRRPPRDGDIVLTREPQDGDESRVRFE